MGLHREGGRRRTRRKADAHLKKFIDENPKRPEAIRAAAEAAATLAEEAVREYGQAKRMEDKEKRVGAMEAVRNKFLSVRERFVGALKVNLAPLKKTSAKDRQRQNREDDVLDSRVKVAMVDFYVGLTYPKTSTERVTNMEAAAKEFDNIYQANRETPTLWSLTAHYFTGRCKQEEGKFADAKDNYEEVLVADTKDTSTTPDNPKAVRKQVTATPLDDLLAEVEQHYLECILAEDLRGYLKEVSEWRTQHKLLERGATDTRPSASTWPRSPAGWPRAEDFRGGQEQVYDGGDPRAQRHGEDPQPVPGGGHQAPPPAPGGKRRRRGRWTS